MHTTDTTAGGRTVLTKILAIVGFFVLLTLIAWVSVQGFRYAPKAFSSLASIVESIEKRDARPELVVTTSHTSVSTDEDIVLIWNNVGTGGTYDFEYACTLGVSLEMKLRDRFTIPCATTFVFPADVFTASVRMTSEKQRFIEVPITLSYHASNVALNQEKETRVTVINAKIPMSIAQDTSDSKTEVVVPPKDTPVHAVPVVVPAPVVKNPLTPSVITYIPVSSPSGFADLDISFRGIGIMKGDTFIAKGSYDNDVRGGLTFEVKNVGTKTSEKWKFTSLLPSGVTYTSELQNGLKPNERATFTLGFDFNPKKKNDSAKIVSTLTTSGDVNASNNSFTWSAKVTD